MTEKSSKRWIMQVTQSLWRRSRCSRLQNLSKFCACLPTRYTNANNSSHWGLVFFLYIIIFVLCSVTGTVICWLRFWSSSDASERLWPLRFLWWLCPGERSLLWVGHKLGQLLSCASGLQHVTFCTFSNSDGRLHHNNVIRFRSPWIYSGPVSYSVYHPTPVNGKSSDDGE